MSFFLFSSINNKSKLFIYPWPIVLAVIEMGHSGVDVEISDLEKKESTEVKALVDTGARKATTFILIPTY
nr:hypothetical protein BSM_10830 [uncultured archaeon]